MMMLMRKNRINKILITCSTKQTSSLLLHNTIQNQSLFNNNALWTNQSRNMVFNKLTLPGPKSLDQIVKINLLEKESAEAIRTIWHKYHAATNDVIAHTLSTEQYRCLEYRGQQYPMFVLPLFRNIGYVNMVLQFQRDHVLFSSLREFQKIGEFATPHLTLSHFTEFSHSKNLVLMRGEVNTKEIDKGQAKEIVEIMYRFYLEDKLFHEFVEPFNKTPHTFSFEKLMHAIQLVRPPQITKSKLMEKMEGKYVNTKKYEKNKKDE